MDSIFGDVYGRKRIAPGFVKSLIGAELSHDCTTLGGNSGSPVIDIETGLVVGLHKSGVFLKSNGAVAGGSLGDLVTKALKPPVVALSTINRETTPQIVQMSKGSERPMSGTEISVTIPITVTVRIGEQTPTTIAATSGARPCAAIQRRGPKWKAPSLPPSSFSAAAPMLWPFIRGFASREE